MVAFHELWPERELLKIVVTPDHHIRHRQHQTKALAGSRTRELRGVAKNTTEIQCFRTSRIQKGKWNKSHKNYFYCKIMLSTTGKSGYRKFKPNL
jgi:hypothetical protein